MIYKYKVDFTTEFKKEYKKIKKQGKDLEKLKNIIEKLACGIVLEQKFKDHKLLDNRKIKNCRECHIEPDWLLVYRIEETELILLLIENGSHSELFNK